MQTIKGTVVETPDGLALQAPGGLVPLVEEHAGPVAASGAKEVVIGVRPEHLAITEDGILPATVSVIESLGHERHIICRLEDGEMVIVRQQADETPPKELETLALTADPQHLHLFDAATDQRIG
jgi:ABC-type sugar transport system ATPase subunit